MSYKVLYRKYRPDNFDDVIGQKYVVEILKNSIKEGHIAHAYLFSGPRGTGKTSMARILAKSLNCLDNKEGKACEKCNNCISFLSNPDIIEIDAASNNGVEEIRELINNVKIMPSSLKYKVYIIDEVHMLSQSAFNALLLTLEEPPEHVIFILATTNIESVPITILSRCQKFDFRRIDDDDIVNRLKFICEKENISYEEDGLREIAILSDGGLRDALSILDQISKNGKVITLELVSREVGSISNKKINDLIKSIDKKNLENFNKIFDEFYNNNLNYKVIIKKLIYSLSDISIKILNDESNWNLSFDDCKNMIFELNDLINKINININAYLLIKILLLNYFKKENVPIEASNYGKIVELKSEKNLEIDGKKDIDFNRKNTFVNSNNNLKNINEDFINRRINNCFVNASKNNLLSIQKIWSEFIKKIDVAQIKGLISDTQVVTASDSYAILITTINHQEIELNQNIDNIEKSFNNFFNKEYKLIFLNEEKWNIEKKKYINNLQKKYKYEFISEDIEENNDSEDEMTTIANNLFAKDKIEIE